MTNPTSNFGWQMPESTDLVTNLPADFEVFGQAVDTDFADLNGGTTGQVLSKTSNTDLDFTWVAPTAGDIEGVTAGIGISGGGTSGTVTVTNSMATAITTSGDLIQGTGSGTFARLATGTSGQYLTTNGTTNSWVTATAGSLTLLSTTTLSGASTTISSISQSYTNLYITVQRANLSASGYFRVRPNASSACHNSYLINATAASATYDGIIMAPASLNLSAAETFNGWAITINDYANAANDTTKPFECYGQYYRSNDTLNSLNNAGGYFASGAITSLEFQPASGTFNGGTVKVYGVN